ncbi:Cupredoxin [Thamnocephalis sphaerospora]|uniref:Cupredoxin n=1 Tax=Thamnocephalis sphaerospora TaxID=78915 RepID=A0A4P9XJW4_9FUNG|nr:Cupredoxin [Thamnocephalis sphaerospora]RKP06707.1 Cupredoxin [Thamnocephalis sphaerospora]|eukprot:RKP06078.1 Cupredoxin [Thamnocephalis sphaerospora]
MFDTAAGLFVARRVQCLAVAIALFLSTGIGVHAAAHSGQEHSRQHEEMVAACQPPSCTRHRHYIAAEEVLWDYLPSSQDRVWHREFAGVQESLSQVERRVYRKAVYRGYEDGTFTKRVPREEWLGILGPVIRAEVGDLVEIVFYNAATEPFSIHPHGVFYTAEHEGAMHADSGEGAGVRPGETFTYIWQRAGPADEDPGSILWLYHSHHNEPMDVNAGLVGPILVYRRGWLRTVSESPKILNATTADAASTRSATSDALIAADSTFKRDTAVVATTHTYARDVDREFVLWLDVLDENSTPYYLDNMRRVQEGAIHPPGSDDGLPMADREALRKHMFYSVNGRVFGNLAGIIASQGDRVRWHLAALGTENGVHHARWHGPAGAQEERGERRDGVSLLPATFRTLDSVVDQVGQWLINCETQLHLSSGMAAWYRVLPRSAEDELDQAAKGSTADMQKTDGLQFAESHQTKPAKSIAQPFSFEEPPPPPMSAGSWVVILCVFVCWLVGVTHMLS